MGFKQINVERKSINQYHVNLATKSVFPTVGNIKESVFIFVFVINCTNSWAGVRDNLIDKQENCFLRGQVDSFPDDPHELSYRDIGGNQVLPLVNIRDAWSFYFFHYDRNAVRILVDNLCRFLAAVLDAVINFEIPLHDWWWCF